MNEAKIFYGMSYEEYEKLEGIRSSDLGNLNISPRYYQHCKTNPKKPTDSMEFGKLVHSAMEDCLGFRERLKYEPKFEGKTKDGKVTTSLACTEVKQKREEWVASLPANVILVKEEWYEKLDKITESIRTNRFVRELILDGHREISIQVRDPETGLLLKCRPDLISRNSFLVDYKTTSDTADSYLLRAIFDRNHFFYILQMAHYVHCMKLAGVGDGSLANFIFIETVPSFDIANRTVGSAELDFGEEVRVKLMALYQECTARNKWPGHPQKAILTGIPTWVQNYDVNFDFDCDV